MIEATSRPAASDAHPMGSSGGELTAASALRGSVIDGMSLTKPGGGPATTDSTPVLIGCHGCFLGSLLRSCPRDKNS